MRPIALSLAIGAGNILPNGDETTSGLYKVYVNLGLDFPLPNYKIIIDFVQIDSAKRSARINAKSALPEIP